MASSDTVALLLSVAQQVNTLPCVASSIGRILNSVHVLLAEWVCGVGGGGL